MGVNWGAGASGAASGAAMGTTIMPGWGTAIGAGIGGLAGLFSGNPADGYKDAGKQINKSWQEALGYTKPYQQAGMDAYGGLKDATGRLLNPEELENQWSKGYETSPYAKDEMARSTESGLDAASSMGLMGSSPALQNIQHNSSTIMNQDRRNYLQDLMQKYMAGVQSSQNIFGTGANTAQFMGAGAMQTGEDLAKMKYGETNAPGEQMNSMFSQMMSRYGNGATPGAKPGGGYDLSQAADGTITRYTPRGGAY